MKPHKKDDFFVLLLTEKTISDNSVGLFRKEKLREKHRVNGITAQTMKFSNKDFFSKCDQIRSFPSI